MLLVLPYCQRERAMTRKLAKLIARLGTYSRHDLLLVTSDAPLDEDIFETLKPVFRKVDSVRFTVPERGWPKTPNYIFRETATFLANKMKNTQPWYFMEPDTVPLKAGWLDALEAEYHAKKKPFVGFICPTRMRRPDGTEGEWGSHMVGTGMYPPRVGEYCRLLPWVGDTVAWDCYLQWEIVGDGTPEKSKAAHTDLIHHNWGSCNYKRDPKSGKLVCSKVKPISLNEPVGEKPVVVHGCKDESLLDLVLRELDGVKEPAPPKQVVQADGSRLVVVGKKGKIRRVPA